MKKFEVVQKWKDLGLTVKEISNKTGWKYSTVYYHFDLDQKTKHTVRQKDRRARLYKIINSYRNKCSRCEESHISCLDFHHIDKSKKSFGISGVKHNLGIRNINKLIAEIEKCIVLCSNCHRKEHYNDYADLV